MLRPPSLSWPARRPGTSQVRSSTWPAVRRTEGGSDGTGQAGTAVQNHGLAGHPGRVAGEQERDGPGDVLRNAKPLERVAPGYLHLTPLVQRLGKVRLDDAGCHRVDPYVGAELIAQLGGEMDQCRLAHGVPAQQPGCPQAGDRGNIDDRPARSLLGAEASVNGLLRPAESAENVDLQDLARRLDLRLQHGPVGGVDARVVDQIVESPERLPSRGNHLVLVRRIIGMTGDGQCMRRTAKSLDSPGKRLGPARGDDDPRAVGDKAPRDAQADPPAGAGDDGDLLLVGDAHVADAPSLSLLRTSRIFTLEVLLQSLRLRDLDCAVTVRGLNR